MTMRPTKLTLVLEYARPIVGVRAAVGLSTAASASARKRTLVANVFGRWSLLPNAYRFLKHTPALT